MAFNVIKRFVAGAVCPSCSAMDKLVVFSENNKDYRECVSCGYKSEMNFKPQVREMDTRVNQTEEKVQSETQVLQFPPK
jgi:uncharacterized metal-binding protein (TIGR02443 family)